MRGEGGERPASTAARCTMKPAIAFIRRRVSTGRGRAVRMHDVLRNRDMIGPTIPKPIAKPTAKPTSKAAFGPKAVGASKGGGIVQTGERRAPLRGAAATTKPRQRSEGITAEECTEDIIRVCHPKGLRLAAELMLTAMLGREGAKASAPQRAVAIQIATSYVRAAHAPGVPLLECVATASKRAVAGRAVAAAVIAYVRSVSRVVRILTSRWLPPLAGWWHCGIRGRVSESAVVLPSFQLVAQNIVCLRDFFESLLSRFALVWVLVRVVRERQAAIRLLDVGCRALLADFEHVVEGAHLLCVS
mmetsp:Transcript_10223/g.23657  ORF Transcript_10223/g.23657 Transcript_10223/m.23657 type:complete len:303 (+) Transcript_10223:726-1634(+)